jgi:integrase/recombinase XerD
MSASTGKTPHKRGQRKNQLDIPQRLLDRRTPSVLEAPAPTATMPHGKRQGRQNVL